jgi:hypothetical protein
VGAGASQTWCRDVGGYWCRSKTPARAGYIMIELGQLAADEQFPAAWRIRHGSTEFKHRAERLLWSIFQFRDLPLPTCACEAGIHNGPKEREMFNQPTPVNLLRADEYRQFLAT